MQNVCIADTFKAQNNTSVAGCGYFPPPDPLPPPYIPRTCIGGWGFRREHSLALGSFFRRDMEEQEGRKQRSIATRPGKKIGVYRTLLDERGELGAPKTGLLVWAFTYIGVCDRHPCRTCGP